MVILDKGYVARTCSVWLRECGQMLVKKINERYFIDAICSGEELAVAEKSIRETVESKKVLEGSLDWLRNVFSSEIELPWSRIRELVLEDDSDLWDEIFEDAFVGRMKVIVDTGLKDLTRVVNVADTIRAIGEISGGHGQIDFHEQTFYGWWGLVY